MGKYRSHLYYYLFLIYRESEVTGDSPTIELVAAADMNSLPISHDYQDRDHIFVCLFELFVCLFVHYTVMH